MTCEYCGTEHPPQQIANPHYCIEMLLWELDIAQERIKELEAENARLRYPDTEGSLMTKEVSDET